MLRVGTLELQVPELAIRQKLAINEDGAADPRAERQENDNALVVAPTCYVVHLGETGGVCVVDHLNLANQRPADASRSPVADPGFVDVGR